MWVEAGGIRASVMARWQSRHRKTAHDRRQQRLRAEARTASRLLRAFQEVQGHRGGQLSKLGMALQAALAGTESAPTHTEDREEADADGIPQVRISERIMEQTVDVPVPQETEATETACAEPAPAVARRQRRAKRVAPTPAVTDTAPAPANECAAPTSAVTSAGQAPVMGYGPGSPAAPSPVTECALRSTSGSDRQCGVLICGPLSSCSLCGCNAGQGRSPPGGVAGGGDKLGGSCGPKPPDRRGAASCTGQEKVRGGAASCSGKEKAENEAMRSPPVTPPCGKG